MQSVYENQLNQNQNLLDFEMRPIPEASVAERKQEIDDGGSSSGEEVNEDELGDDLLGVNNQP